MPLRVRLDLGALARALGHPDAHPKGPDVLHDDVIPVLDISPYVQSSGTPAAGFAFSPTGRVRAVYLATPNAGAELTVTVPAGVAWEIISLFARFVASAAAANRLPRLVVDDDLVNNVALIPSNHTFGANSDQVIYWARGVNTQTGTINEHGRDIPHLFLAGPGYRVRTAMGNIQAGDQWSAARLMVREWNV